MWTWQILKLADQTDLKGKFEGFCCLGFQLHIHGHLQTGFVWQRPERTIIAAPRLCQAPPSKEERVICVEHGQTERLRASILLVSSVIRHAVTYG